ncbi:hypothetical protein JAO29_13195 [Edaphobacter sp. HDX4]|uniref:hypothetical protein n=1 Tax=Edaphobacter sp. HDX4 TaxID=2794064 RepID=UPI002FE5DC64
MKTSRYVLAAAATAIVFFLVWVLWPSGSKKSQAPATGPQANQVAAPGGSPADSAVTTVYAHNLELRKGPQFRIYVRWLRGEMVPTRPTVVPSLDDENSFILQIDRGLVHVNIGDITNFLNASMAARSPLTNMKLTGEGQQIKLSGTMHKLLLPLPVEVAGTVSPTPDGRVLLRIAKINVLKMPVKGLLSGLKVEVDDLIGKQPIEGVAVKDNDIYFNTTELLPPPHIRGNISSISLRAPDVVVTYGSTSAEDDSELAKWHNFLRLRGGSVSFGKLIMRDADLTLIDASGDRWFDLDLTKYHEQLVKGYSRMTPEKGLEMFLPDVGQALAPGSVSLDTLRDKRNPLPNPQTVQ